METQELINLLKGLNVRFAHYDGSEESIKEVNKVSKAWSIRRRKSEIGSSYLEVSHPTETGDGDISYVELDDFVIRGSHRILVCTQRELEYSMYVVRYNPLKDRYEIPIPYIDREFTSEFLDVANILGWIGINSDKNYWEYPDIQIPISYYPTNVKTLDEYPPEFWTSEVGDTLHCGDCIIIKDKKISIEHVDNFQYCCHLAINADYAMDTSLDYKGKEYAIWLIPQEEYYRIEFLRYLGSKESSKVLVYYKNKKEWDLNLPEHMRLFLKDMCRRIDNKEIDTNFYSEEC